jgi:RNA polymerase sigma factor (sigma-70 family)
VNLNPTLAQTDIISQAFRQERKRLFDFIRRRMPTDTDAEDILQDVFYQLSVTYSVENPIERIGSWLFTVAGNKIKDWYRKKKETRLEDMFYISEDGDELSTVNLSMDAEMADELIGRTMFWQELDRLLEQLPPEQRDVFIQHAIEDKSFKEISGESQVPVNTLLSRKRYAVLFLRERLKELYDEIINF